MRGFPDDDRCLEFGEKATALTMKSTKDLKETLPLPWTRRIEASLFFMLFMVDTLWNGDRLLFLTV